VSYPHYEAPCVIHIGGVRAFNPGDSVPLDTAKRIGLVGKYPKLKVIEPEDSGRDLATFTDADVSVVDDAPSEPKTPAKS
jgi:hypothetical protein